MSVKITHIEINNYRSCLLTRFPVSPALTTLIGSNGAGKSNILRAIDLLEQIKGSHLFEMEEGDTDFYSTSLIKLDVIINDITYGVRIDFVYSNNDKNQDDVRNCRFRIINKSIKGNRKYTNVDLFPIQYVTRRHSGLSYKRFLTKIENAPLGPESFELYKYLKNIKYYSATVFSDPSKCPISFELEDTGSLRLNPNLNTGAHTQFLFDLYNSFQNDETTFNKFSQIVGSEGIGLIDDILFKEVELPSNSYEVRSGGQIMQIERTKVLIIPHIKIDNTTLSPNQLSEGTFKALALIYYIINDTSDLLLIEEPEVCVHHGLLNSIIELITLESRRKQIFISTHSDSILDKMNPENVVLVTKDKQIGTQATAIPDSLSKNDYKALKRYLETVGNLGEYWREGGLYNG